jgi:hypothetical protein
MGKKILFLIIVLLGISIHSYAQSTVKWTGLGDGTSWNQGTNWDSGSEPATGDYVEVNIAVTITGTATNIPARVRVWAAVAVTLDLDLTIAHTGGTNKRNIQILDGGTLLLGNGVNPSVFTLSTDASTYSAISLSNPNTNLVVGANSTVNIIDGYEGIKMSDVTAVITNNGDINIMNYRSVGLLVVTGTMENNSIITINTPSANSTSGVRLTGANAIFNNNAAGNITVKAAIVHEFDVSNGSTNNWGTMNLISSDTTGSNSQNPLSVTGTFNNNSTGVVNADGGIGSVARAVYVHAGGSISNSGTLNLYGGAQGSRFFIRDNVTNNACGIIDMDDGRVFVNRKTFTNNGLLKTTYGSAVTRSANGHSINNGFALTGSGTWWTTASGTGSGTDNGLTFGSGVSNFAVDAVNSCANADIGIDAAHNWYSDAAMTNLVGANDDAGMLTINDGAFPTGATGPHTLYTCYGSDVRMTISNLFGACLPIELISFEGIRKEDHVELTWATASEENNAGFEIERAYKNGPGLEWKMIDFVEGNGTTTDVQTYSYDDVQPFQGTNYYRLKQLDFDGQFEYSDVISVDFGRGSDIFKVKISPNPARTQLTIENGIGRVAIFNILGQPVKNIQVTNASYAISLEDLPNGQYIIRVQKDDGTIDVQQFSKID